MTEILKKTRIFCFEKSRNFGRPSASSLFTLQAVIAGCWSSRASRTAGTRRFLLAAPAAHKELQKVEKKIALRTKGFDPGCCGRSGLAFSDGKAQSVTGTGLVLF
jgi:hypothetical protein